MCWPAQDLAILYVLSREPHAKTTFGNDFVTIRLMSCNIALTSRLNQQYRPPSFVIIARVLLITNATSSTTAKTTKNCTLFFRHVKRFSHHPFTMLRQTFTGFCVTFNNSIPLCYVCAITKQAQNTPFNESSTRSPSSHWRPLWEQLTAHTWN